MKYERLDKKVDFEPIVIKLTIETEHELTELWYRLTMDESDLEKVYEGCTPALHTHLCKSDLEGFGDMIHEEFCARGIQI